MDVMNKSKNSNEENVKKALTASLKRIENDQTVDTKFFRNKKKNFVFF
jgi:hypothetical protein